MTATSEFWTQQDHHALYWNMGTSVGLYTYSRLIGGGAYGRVYEAKRRSDGMPCALKRPREDASLEEIERFRREIQLQASLKHRHIVPILASDAQSNSPCFIMPRARESLRQLFDYGQFGPEYIFIIEQVARGLIHAHESGIIHRDLSPENILLFEDEEGTYAAIADFGHGRSLTGEQTTLTLTNRRIGKAAYASPEQHQDAKRVDARSDIYSLGKLLAEVLTGKVPHHLDPMEVPSPFRLIIKKACERTPDRRYQTVSEMLEALRYVTVHRSVLEKPVGTIKNELAKTSSCQDIGPAESSRLTDLFLTNIEDQEVLKDVLPHIPSNQLRALLKYQSKAMEEIVTAYDHSINGSLKFEYCDTVANFYHLLFENTESLTIRSVVIRRLPALGARHNRWHVGKTLEKIIKQTSNIELLLALRDTLSKDPQATRWCTPYLLRCSLPSSIKALLHDKDPWTAGRH